MMHEPQSCAFFSLQGLGNSILNFPILNILRQKHHVQVVCYHNGSSTFFKAFHNNVTGVSKSLELLQIARRLNVSESFATYPTWKREISSTLIVRADQKFIMRPLRNAGAWRKIGRYSAEPESTKHDLENNIALLRKVPGSPADNWEKALNIRTALNLPEKKSGRSKILAVHPTASSVVKFYPLKFWTELLSALQENYEQILLFCGSQKLELQFCQAIVNSLGTDSKTQFKICSNFSFDLVAQLIDSADNFIGSDSALMHLSALLDKPTVGLWSFANFRAIYPYGNHAKVYIPTETLAAKTYEYPAQKPAYLKRASALRIAEIVKSNPKPTYEIQPLYKNAVSFYEF